MKKTFLIATVGLILSFTACRYSAGNGHIKNVNPNAARECPDFNIDNTVDYVIAGDANAAARGFKFPLRHPGFQPLMQIKNKSDFVRLFPVMFDKGVRGELKRWMAKGGWSWSLPNWHGEMFGNGAFWRDNPEWKNADKRIHTVLIIGDDFLKYYQRIYAKDKMNLAPEYRAGMAWVYAYFTAEDDSFYGRVDAIGRDERIKLGHNTAERFRVIIFKKGQKPSEKPSEIYLCKYDYEDGITSLDGRIKFEIVSIGTDESPWGWLEYTKDKTRGKNGYVRLKADTPWLEKYKIDLSSGL